MAFTLRLLGHVCRNSLFSTTNRHINAIPLRFVNFSSSRKKVEKVPVAPLIELGDVSYEKICSETLYSLTDYIEDIIEEAPNLEDADVTYGDGVLTVKLGETHGTYVINRQSINKQIWLSSPKSGPKRYDFVGPSKNQGKWIYRRTGESLHELLQNEFEEIVKKDVDFFQLPFGK